jgi:hypothetical protein
MPRVLKGFFDSGTEPVDPLPHWGPQAAIVDLAHSSICISALAYGPGAQASCGDNVPVFPGGQGFSGRQPEVTVRAGETSWQC